MPQGWKAWWIWLWVVVTLTLIALSLFIPFKYWALAALMGFGSMETIGLAIPNDAYPPLTHVIRTYIPREIALALMYGFTAAAAATWLKFARPGWLGLVFAFVGWLTTHFDVAIRQQAGGRR